MKLTVHNTTALVLALTTSLPAPAHHAFSLFDQTRIVTITGTIKTFEWVNPHAWIWVVVPNDQGGTDVYGLETAGTGMLRRMGIERDTFAPGTKVTMDIHPLKSGDKGGEWIRATLADGTVIDSAERRNRYSNGGVTE